MILFLQLIFAGVQELYIKLLKKQNRCKAVQAEAESIDKTFFILNGKTAL